MSIIFISKNKENLVLAQILTAQFVSMKVNAPFLFHHFGRTGFML